MQKSFSPKAALQQAKNCTATSKMLRCRKVALSCRFPAGFKPPPFRHPRLGPAEPGNGVHKINRVGYFLGTWCFAAHGKSFLQGGVQGQCKTTIFSSIAFLVGKGPFQAKKCPADGVWRIRRGEVPPDAACWTRLNPSKEHLNNVQLMVSGESCEGVFPDTACWTRLRNTWWNPQKLTEMKL